MTRTGMIFLGVCGMFMGWTLIALLLLLYGNDWWLSGLTTLTVFAWLGGLLVVMFQQGRVRAAGTGAIIAAAAYWLLALGPWFSTNVGPTLLTSRLLARVDVMLHGNPQQLQTLAWTAPVPYSSTGNVYFGGSGVVTTGNPAGTIQTTLGPQTTLGFATTVIQGSSVFQPLGHWLLIWLSAGVGGLAVLLLLIRSERQQTRVIPIASATSPGAAP